jgi:hypothetical protein
MRVLPEFSSAHGSDFLDAWLQGRGIKKKTNRDQKKQIRIKKNK